ncbi:hypothetical protein Acor_37540 [Acrocarpospora corrugata]|uniref:Uncharacterized protein n=1 Tax=Acrocarpospora corrugata TaxID=35763 RepID=A0A5M3W0G1_9ACTN|nr:hypothetical protein [Acrocarpospora corrugata]GES01690.1 hypothetical protein Acor_37540 [Acrocarpospora corrugata]
MIRLWWWTERGFAGEPARCPHCGERLELCSRCRGDWRLAEAACGGCGLGWVCPNHLHRWVA